MTKSTTAKKNEIPTNVTIVDGKLILSLPNAQMPVVWQMDIEKAQSAAFTIQEDKKKKSFTLILKTQDGSIDEIAYFDDKEAAVEILMETSTALQNAHGKIKQTDATNNNVPPSASTTKNTDKAGAVIALALIIILSLIWIISASGNIRSKQNLSNESSTNSSASARESSGVPVSADDFLSNR